MSKLSRIEQIAVDTLSVLYHSEDHTPQFYILNALTGGMYTNILYVAEPMEDPDAIIGAGIICLKEDLSDASVDAVPDWSCIQDPCL